MLAALIAGLIGSAAVTSHVPPARDGNIAIREELDAARVKGTVDAYDLFIARHPDHPLAKEARAERKRLVGRRGKGVPPR